jgi:hypothetical protein
LTRIARKIKREYDVKPLQATAVQLKKAVENTWDSQRHFYHYQDSYAHTSFIGETLLTVFGSGISQPEKMLKHPQRLIIEIQSNDESATKPVSITIHGGSQQGSIVETASTYNLLWIHGKACLTTKNIFTSIDKFQLDGLSPKDQVTLSTLGLDQEDITLWSPIWAQIPSQRRVRSFIKDRLNKENRDRFPFGLPAVFNRSIKTSLAVCQEVYMPWNQIIGEGLLAYGFRAEAAQLVTRLMSAVIHSLKKHKAFYRLYHSATGESAGERNAIGGLAPVGLFLETLGIQLLPQNSVIVSGFSPFNWPVTIKYRGMRVIREEKITHVFFPNGQTTSVSSSGNHLVSLT